MRTDESHRKIRVVCNIAATHLERLGFTVLKTATRSPTFDLVAFNDHHTLFISTRRVRSLKTVTQLTNTYQDLIHDMQKTHVPHYVEKQLWIYQNKRGFIIYKLFENGIMKKEMHT
jgi:hypothetical protein